PIRVLTGEGMNWPSLHRDLAAIREVYVLRPRLLYPFVTFETISLVLVLAVVWAGQGRFKQAASAVLMSLLGAPLAMLGVGWLNLLFPLNHAVQAALFIVLAAGIAWAGIRPAAPALAQAGWLGGVTAAAILIDG